MRASSSAIRIRPTRHLLTSVAGSGRAGRDGRGSRSVKVAPAAGSRSSSTRPPWASTMAWTIARPSPAPARGGSRRRAGSGRRCAPGPPGDPGPLSRTHSAGRPLGREPMPISSPAPVCRDRVAGQVQHGLGDPLRIGEHDARRERSSTQRAVAEAGLGEQLGREVAELDRLDWEEVGRSALASTKQVVDDPRSFGPAPRSPDRDGSAVVRIVADQLEVAPDDRDRRPQLVAGVGHEPPLGVNAAEPVEHRVEGAAEAARRSRRHPRSRCAG